MGIQPQEPSGGGVRPSGEVLADQLLDDVGMLLATAAFVQYKVEHLDDSKAEEDGMTLSERMAIVADEMEIIEGISQEAENLATVLQSHLVASEEDVAAAKALVSKARVSFAGMNRALVEGDRASEPELTLGS